MMTYPRRLVFQRRKCLGRLRFFLIRSKDCNLHIVTIIVHYNKCSRRHKSARDDDTIQDLCLCWRKNVVHNGVCATTFSSLRWNQSLGTKGGQKSIQRVRSHITLCGDDKSSVLVAAELHSFVVSSCVRWSDGSGDDERETSKEERKQLQIVTSQECKNPGENTSD